MQTKMIVAAVLSMLAATAQAQGYAGASGGVTKLDADCAGTTTCDTTGSGFKVYGGYQFMPMLAGELVYFNFGKTKASLTVGANTSTLELAASGFGLGAAFNANLAANVPATARLGVASIKAKQDIRGPGGSVSDSESSTQAYFGIDIGYAFTKNFAATLSADFSRLKLNGETGSLRLVGAGLRATF
jgi:OOP family OmpA-OmpF porin